MPPSGFEGTFSESQPWAEPPNVNQPMIQASFLIGENPNTKKTLLKKVTAKK